MAMEPFDFIAVTDRARFTELATRFGWSAEEQLAVAEFVGDAQDRSFTSGQHSTLPD